jgi:hypothetical protein
MEIIGQWAIYGGRPESSDRLLEAENRQIMSNRVCQITRILVEVTENFDPLGTNSLLQWESYEKAFNNLANSNTKVIVVFGIYDQGDDSGKFYHGTRRPP